METSSEVYRGYYVYVSFVDLDTAWGVSVTLTPLQVVAQSLRTETRELLLTKEIAREEIERELFREARMVIDSISER